MYKIDDEFRPSGRVFMKATRENPQESSVMRKSSLKKGPPITTNLDDRRIQFKHEVKHEKTIEALITEYPPGANYRSRSDAASSSSNVYHSHESPALDESSHKVVHYSTRNDSPFDVPDGVNSLHAITRNKRTSTEVLGSSFESKKLSQRSTDGNRRITTHIVRKVTTLSRAEENAQNQNLIQTAQTKATEFGFMQTQAIEPKRPKVC